MSCELTPAAGAFSAILTALIGSTITGLTSGYLVAFMTGWLAWFALFRILHGGVYMLYRGLTQSWIPEPESYSQVDGPDEHDSTPLTRIHDAVNDLTQERVLKPSRYNLVKILWPTQPHQYQPTSRKSRGRDRGYTAGVLWPSLNREVTALGWFGWIYSGLLAPTTQALWLAAHVSRNDDGATKIVKGLSIAVSGLSLCIDCRARFGVALARRCHAAWVRYLFDVTNAMSCLLQAGISATLLIKGILTVNKTTEAENLPAGFGVPTALLAIYPVFSLIWMYGSLKTLPTRDGGRKRVAQAHWAGYFVDIGMGVFAGLFLAAPAFVLFQSASFDESSGGSTTSGYQDLKNFLGCEGVVLWRKVAAVMP